ncbi:hypothetical protein AB0K48_44420, partial [Nonomuraea sp. NPDC055795]
ATAVAAVLIAAGLAVPYLIARPGPAVTGPPEVGGVRVGYVPEGLGPPRRLGAQAKDHEGRARLRGDALRWQAGEAFVQVSVYRANVAVRDSMDILALNLFGRPIEPRGAADPVRSEDGTTALWLADHRLLLEVTVSPGLKSERDLIARGLRVTRWDSAFAGLNITYMPDDMWTAGTPDTYGAALNRLWQGESGRRAEVEVVYGREAATLESLRTTVSATKVHAATVRDLPAYRAATGRSGQMLLWLFKPGIGIKVTTDHLPEHELTLIAKGIQPLPEVGPVDTSLHSGWRTTTRRNPDGKITVSVHRGAGVGTSKWLNSRDSKPATISGRQGDLLNRGTSQTFTWTPEFGLAVVVTAPERDLRRIVKGMAAP